MSSQRGSGRVLAVVGGGVSGLAAAWHAVRSSPGWRVVVLEQAPRTGGALRTHVLDGDLSVDVGAESMLARRPEALELLGELGLADEVVHPATTRAAVWSRGRLHPLPAGTVMGVPGDPRALLGLLTDAEVARVSAEPALPATPVRADVDVASFVAQRVGQAVVDRLVEPLLGGVYAGHASRLSLRATIPSLWPAAVHGASLLDAVRQQVTTASVGAEPVFAGLRGGVARLIAELEANVVAAGAQVRTAACVQALRRNGSGWALELGPAGRGAVVEADAVLLTLPARRAGRLLEPLLPDAARDLTGVTAASMAIATYVVPASVLDGLDVSGFLVPPVEGRLVKAVTFSSLKWPWLRDAAGGRAVFRASVGRAGEEAALQVEDDDLLAAVVADVEQMVGRPVPVRERVLTRWGGALPQYEVGHVERVERIRAEVAVLPGLALAGASYDGVGIPACIASARQAVTRLLDSV